MSLFDKAFDEAQRFIDKNISEDTGTLGKAKKGRLGRTGFFQALAPGLDKGSLQNKQDMMRNPSFRKLGRGAELDVKGAVASGVAANVGHQAIRGIRNSLKDDEVVDVPDVAPAPAQGAGVTAAERAARARAVSSARSRFGIRQTFTTSPLGLQGSGSIGRRSLLGE